MKWCKYGIPISGWFKVSLAIGAGLVLQSCTLEESTVISGRVTAIQSSDTIRVGDKNVRLCGVKPATKHDTGSYAAKAYLIDRVRFRKVRCQVAGSGTPCDGQPRIHADGATVAQCFMYGRDLSQMVTGFTTEPGSTQSLVRKFKTSSPRKGYRSELGSPIGVRLEAIATHAW